MKSRSKLIRPIWNNVQRVNHKNQFVPTAVLTRTGKIPVNTARASGTNKVSTARHDFNRQAVLTNAAMKVNTVKPIVNTVEVNVVSAVGGKGKLLLSPKQVVIGDKKDINGKISPNTIVDPKRPSESQPTPSPPHPNEANVEPQSDPSPRPSPTPYIPDSILEVSGGLKSPSSIHKDSLFDELDDDEIDNMDTEDAQDVGRTRDGLNAKK
ncbi:hypothetical protein Tco_0904456 [Tanacetum coccineum]